MYQGTKQSKFGLKRWAIACLLLTFWVLGCQVLFGEVQVNRSGDSGAQVCATGDFRCNGEYLLTCGSRDTGWTKSDSCATDDLCDAKNRRCAVCKDGEFRCNQADRQQCASDGSSWKTIETCSAENLCSESSCAGCPTDGALDCSQGAALRECRAGVWQVLDTCASPAVCTSTIGHAMTVGEAWDRKCVSAGCSPPGGYQCDSTTLQRCRLDQSGWDTVDTCSSAALCIATVASVSTGADAGVDAGSATNAGAIIDSCLAGCPAAGAFFCAGNTLQKCSDDQVRYDTVMLCDPMTECNPMDGSCGQLCIPGQFQCNAADLRKCGADGHWKVESTCETSELCSASADGSEGHCTPSPCGTNDYSCSGALLQKCKKDRTGYQDAESCASAALCDPKSQRCIEPRCPVPGSYQCFDHDLKQCATDLTQWNEVTKCPQDQYCNSGANPGCLTACPDNPVRCNGKLLEQCSAATGWVTQAMCATADLCNCTQTNPPSCLKGIFKDGCGTVACGGGTLATFQCQGTALQKCQAGRNGWDTVQACGTSAWPPYQNLCYAGSSATDDGYCLTCPVAGELACDADAADLNTCSSDRRAWTKSKDCGSPGCVPVQLGDDFCAVCKAGDARCTGATLQTCPSQAKAWTDTPCATSALCNATKAQCDPPVCDVGSKQCSGAVLQVCNAGRTNYDMLQTCGSGALCNKTKLVCDPPNCTAGQKQCNDAQLQTCNSSLNGWVTSTTCASAALCNKTKLVCDMPTCMPDQKQCMGAVPQTCNSDLNGWLSGTPCATGCNANTDVCNGCNAGQHQCKGTNSQVCSADLSGFVDGTDCGALGCSSASGLCNACGVGQKKCKGSNLQVCSTDQSGFVDGTDCGLPGCNSATNQCNAMACTPGSFNCDGLNHQACNASGTAWVTDQICGLTCDPVTGCTDCDPITLPSCVVNTLKTCDATGHWVTNDCGTGTCNPAGSGSCDP